MTSLRQAVIAASLLTAMAAMPASVSARDQQAPADNAASDATNEQDNEKGRARGKEKVDRKGEKSDRNGNSDAGGPPGAANLPDLRKKKTLAPNLGGGNGQGMPGSDERPKSTFSPPPHPEMTIPASPPPAAAETFPKKGLDENKFGAENRTRLQKEKTGAEDNVEPKAEDVVIPNARKKKFDRFRDRQPAENIVPATPPGEVTPKSAETPPPLPSSGPPPSMSSIKTFDQLRKARREKIEAGGNVVIEEPGKRTIIKKDDRIVIQHDETERLKRVAPNARFEKGAGGTTLTVVERPGNVKIYTETDANGQLIRRYRRGPDGRDVIIIDNRRKKDNFGKNLATGVGIGLGVAAGAALLNALVDVPPPRVRIPRDKYIVEYERASDEDIYEALSAPPIDDYSDRYTLDEIRATARLRDRMRRVDLDEINFAFGSWEVAPSQYPKLARIARAMMRIINRNPNEVFMIEGYTDAVGSREDNLSLSDRRAESVAEVLTEQFQVPFENLVTQGYGEDFLKVPTQLPEVLNRRVAVRRITPLLARGDGPPPPRGDRYDRDDDYGRDDRDYDRSREHRDDPRGGYDYSPYRGDRAR